MAYLGVCQGARVAPSELRCLFGAAPDGGLASFPVDRLAAALYRLWFASLTSRSFALNEELPFAPICRGLGISAAEN